MEIVMFDIHCYMNDNKVLKIFYFDLKPPKPLILGSVLFYDVKWKIV